ncbi:MAG: hypothetical protein ACFCUW_11220 [Kiloniellaceae bacterium]
MGQLVEIPAPAIEAVYACVKLLNKALPMDDATVTLKKAWALRHRYTATVNLLIGRSD